MIIIWIMLAAGVGGAVIASNKNRSAIIWGAGCFLFPFLLLLITVQPRRGAPKHGQPELDVRPPRPTQLY